MLNKPLHSESYDTSDESRDDMSKYESVDKAVEWSVSFLKAVLRHEKKQSENVLYYDVLVNVEKAIKDDSFKKKLEDVLVRELDNNTKKNSGISRRIRNTLYDIRNYNDINLEKAINKALVELSLPPLGCPPLPNYFLISTSKVTPNTFIGNASPFIDFKNNDYEFKQRVHLPLIRGRNNLKK